MGWLFTQDTTKKEQIAERTKGWDTTIPDGVFIKNFCLKHCYRGNRFSGILWTVWERTFEKDGSQAKAPERWIGCDLLRYQNGYGWGYKDMAEEMHPFFYSCPLGYLTLVPVACEVWREGVREYHARAKARRAARRMAHQQDRLA